ncbi:MAG: hypothetical protein ABIR46_00820 [Candidatus Saccharimonadales bacterium]
MNTNNIVKVRLTRVGEEILRKHYEELTRSVNRKATYLDPDTLVRKHDSEGGQQEFQMWDLMNIFGPHMINGTPQVFQNNQITI